MLTSVRLTLICACVLATVAPFGVTTPLLAHPSDSRASVIARSHVWMPTDVPRMDPRRSLDPWSSGVPSAFDVEPVLWVQSWASPALTRVMNGISLVGYTPAYITFAVLLAFGHRLRAGAGLLLLMALTGALSDAAKMVVSFPRPDAVDTRVRSLELLQLDSNKDSESPAGGAGAVDTFGFPSGHVAATTGFLIGLALLFRWRWAWRAMLICVPLMGLSRMYLGRHFAGDVLGGIAVGTIGAAIAVLWWKLPDLENGRGWRVARRALYTGAGLAATTLIAGIPPPYESGRLIGFAIGAMLVARAAEPDDDASPGVRARRIALASMIYGITWWATGEGLEAIGTSDAPVGALIAGALPAAVLLPGPLYLERWCARQKASI